MYHRIPQTDIFHQHSVTSSFQRQYKHLTQMIMQGHIDDARHVIKTLLENNPEHTIAQSMQAYMTAMVDSDCEKSIEMFEHIIEKRCDVVEIIIQYCDVLKHYKYYKKFEDVLIKSLRNHPDYILFYIYLSRHYMTANQIHKALPLLLEAIKIEKNNQEVIEMIASCYRLLVQLDDALYYYQKLLSLDPLSFTILFDYIGFLLIKGDYDEAWKLYDVRWYCTIEHHPHEFYASLPLWFPQTQEEKTHIPPLIIWHEGHMDDMMIFYSALSHIITVSQNTIIISTVPSMAKLLQQSFPTIEVVVDYPPLQWLKNRGITHHLPLGDVMGLFSHHDIFPRKNWLKTDQALSTQFQHSIYKEKKGKKLIGICWQYRSQDIFPLKDFLNLLKRYNMIGLSLEEMTDDEYMYHLNKEFGCEIISTSLNTKYFLNGAASLIDICDGVIMVDCLMAHIAGAIGKKGLVLSSFSSSWHWGLKAQSPFYDSLKILRLPHSEATANVFLNLIESELQQGFFS